MPEQPTAHLTEKSPQNFVDQFYYLLTHQQIEELFLRGELTFEADFTKLPKHTFAHLRLGDIYQYRFADGELKKIQITDLKPLDNNEQQVTLRLIN